MECQPLGWLGVRVREAPSAVVQVPQKFLPMCSTIRVVSRSKLVRCWRTVIADFESPRYWCFPGSYNAELNRKDRKSEWRIS
jgi:hypothetical protein